MTQRSKADRIGVSFYHTIPFIYLQAKLYSQLSEALLDRPKALRKEHLDKARAGTQEAWRGSGPTSRTKKGRRRGDALLWRWREA